MGTHPIFESDFDCLTESKKRKMATGLVGLSRAKDLPEGYNTLSNFVVGKKIGKGQFSEVYKSTSRCDGRPVALKKVQLFHMMDAKSRSDCIREIDLLKDRCIFQFSKL